MQIYKCSNCGGTYNEFANYYYCPRCNYPLKKAEDVKVVKHPELSDNSRHIIGTVPSTSKNQVACPYCKSTNCKKITNTSKAVHTAIFGIFSIGRNSKNYHCNKCGSDF